MTATKKEVMSIVLVVYEDGTHEKKISLKKHKDTINFASQITFSAMCGSLAQSLMNYFKQHYPSVFPKIEAQVNFLYEDFLKRVENMKKEQEAEDNGKKIPLIRASQVFGGSK